MELADLTAKILAFRDARDWQQFHRPNQLATAISIEAAELQEHFLWKSPEQIQAHLDDPKKFAALSEEVADVLIYGLLLANELGIDPAQAITEKLAKNDAKYTVEKARGRNAKYTEL